MRAMPGPGPALALLAACGCLATGCVRRTITISTDPPGAMVWLNDREIGRSPVDVDFDYYGTYDVRLEQEGYEPQMTSGDAKSPWWDTVGLDLVAEVLPFRLHSRVGWHYVLEPINDDPEALTQRARDLRAQVSEAEVPAQQAPPPTTDNDDPSGP
ncbi:MAG: PEGA domain-containing protein [Planctomycetota bacterium]